MNKYDVAAFIWPSYTGDEPRTRIFWPDGEGEWQTVRSAKSLFDGHKWPRKPLWGYENEADPVVMEHQIEEALSHGVNTFIYDWYWFDNRPFLEQCLDNGFLKASNSKKMNFYLMWANHDASTLWDKRTSDKYTVIWEGTQNFEQFKKLVAYWIEKYFKIDNYYKIDGKPVFMLYDPLNFIKGFGYNSEESIKAIQYFRNEVKKAGFPDLYLQIVLMPIYWDQILEISEHEFYTVVSDLKNTFKAWGVDSGTLYQLIHIARRKPDEDIYDIYKYNDVIEDMVNMQDILEDKYGFQYIPNVSIGWDNNARFNVYQRGLIIDSTPEKFKQGLALAKKYIDEHPNNPKLITINSWNEWTEDSYLEPDDLNGYGYLNAVKDVFGE